VERLFAQVEFRLFVQVPLEEYSTSLMVGPNIGLSWCVYILQYGYIRNFIYKNITKRRRKREKIIFYSELKRKEVYYFIRNMEFE